jgi:hypothetical protein
MARVQGANGSEQPPRQVLVLGEDRLFVDGCRVALEREGWRMASIDEDRTVDVPLAVIDADAPDADAWDGFSGVGLVPAARSALRRHGTTMVVAVTRRVDDPLLQIRLFDAGATHVIARGALASGDVVDALTRGAAGPVRLHANDTTRAAWGLRRVTNLGAGLEHISRSGLDRALAEGVPANQVGVTRRGMMSLRATVAAVAGIGPSAVLSANASPPTDPTWRDLVRLLNAARGAVPTASPPGSAARD